MRSYCGGVPGSDCNITSCDPNNEPDLHERPTNLDPTHVELVMTQPVDIVNKIIRGILN